jgi:hypothetical protein
MASNDVNRKCVDELKKKFSVYDNTVDIVSCWQSLLIHAYEQELNFFDRYPSADGEEVKKPLTPDFAILFTCDFGLIFEIKRTFPLDDIAFKKEMDQLEKYCNTYHFKTKSGTYITTSEYNVVLIIFLPNDSYHIAKRINDYLDGLKAENPMKKRLVVLECINQTVDVEPKYIFRKIPHVNTVFLDSSLPRELQLEELMGVQRISVQVKPSQFSDIKVNEVFCNDPPPPIFLAIYLWLRIFYDLLTEPEKLEWTRGKKNQIIPLKVRAIDIKDRINKKCRRDNVVRCCEITLALDFLVSSELAIKVNHDEYQIKYHNLTGKKFGVDGEDCVKEYVQRFTYEYCNNHTEIEKKSKNGKISGTQRTFD